MKTRLVLAVTFATAFAPAARAIGLDTSGTGAPPAAPPPPPVVNCSLSPDNITVTSFADILGYSIKGPCTVTFPGTSIKPVTSSYEGGGSWNSTNGMVNEFLKGRDAKNQLWEIHGGGTCKLDPWMTGPAAASCSTSIASASPNSPAKFVKSVKVPISASVLDQQARGWLTGKTLHAIVAEHQAPLVTKPVSNVHATFPLALAIYPGPDSPTKNFALEWEAKVNGVWTPKSVIDQAGLTASLSSDRFGGLGDWRVRARAHQTTKAAWSGWRTFTLPILGPPAMATPSPCGNTKTYGATYDVSAMPSSLAAGLTTTVTIKVTNGSNQIWAAGSNFHLAYHWVQNGNPVVSEGERTNLPSAVSPCGTISLSANLKTPPGAGTYQIQWDMVLEGQTWFSNQGVPTGNKDVTIGAPGPMPPPPPAKK